MAGITIYVIDRQNVEHRLDMVTDIWLDRLSFAFNKGTYRDSGVIYSSPAGTADAGVPTAGIASGTSDLVLPASATPSTTAVPFVTLPDQEAHVAPRAKIEIWSIFEFVIDGWTLGTDSGGQHLYPFFMAADVKGIATRSTKTYVTG